MIAANEIEQYLAGSKVNQRLKINEGVADSIVRYHPHNGGRSRPRHRRSPARKSVAPKTLP